MVRVESTRDRRAMPSSTRRASTAGLRAPRWNARCEGPADEVLLAAMRPRSPVPSTSQRPSAEHLVGAGAGEGEGLLRVERDAAGVGDVEPGVAVAHRLGEVHRHPVDGRDQVPEAGEVDLDVVVHREVEGVGDRGDQRSGPALDGGVDPRVPPVPAIGTQRSRGSDSSVARSRDGLDPQEHDRVGADADVPADPDRVVVGEAVGGVGADDAGSSAARSRPSAVAVAASWCRGRCAASRATRSRAQVRAAPAVSRQRDDAGER